MPGGLDAMTRGRCGSAVAGGGGDPHSPRWRLGLPETYQAPAVGGCVHCCIRRGTQRCVKRALFDPRKLQFVDFKGRQHPGIGSPAAGGRAAASTEHAEMDRPSFSPGPWAVLLAALACAIGTSRAADQAGGVAFDPLAGAAAELGSPVTITAAIEAGADGRPDVLAVTATLEAGWHLYSITQKPGGPLATVIAVAGDSARWPSGPFVPDSEPDRHRVDDVPAWKGLVLEEHAGKVTWRAPLGPGVGDVRGTVSLQLCQENACTPPDTIAFTAAAAGGGAADASGAALTASVHRPERVHAELRATLREAGAAGRRALAIEIVPEDGWHVYKPAGSAASGVGQGKPTIVARADRMYSRCRSAGRRARRPALRPRRPPRA